MSTPVIAAATFALLVSVSLLSLYLHPRLPERCRDAETVATVVRIANLFVVITSLVFGLLITSSKGAFEAIDRNEQNYGTDLILLVQEFWREATTAANLSRICPQPSS